VVGGAVVGGAGAEAGVTELVAGGGGVVAGVAVEPIWLDEAVCCGVATVDVGAELLADAGDAGLAVDALEVETTNHFPSAPCPWA
jgi:hypothetical protein